MSEQENIQIVRRTFDFFNSHKPDSADQYLAENIQAEAPGVPGPMNKAQIHTYNHRFFDAFPDIHFDVGDIIAQGDRVCATWVSKGTHTAAFTLPTGTSIPPTNKKVSVSGCTVVELRNNLVTRQQIYFDQVTFLMQLGLMTEQDLTQRTNR